MNNNTLFDLMELTKPMLSMVNNIEHIKERHLWKCSSTFVYSMPHDGGYRNFKINNILFILQKVKSIFPPKVSVKVQTFVLYF